MPPGKRRTGSPRSFSQRLTVRSPRCRYSAICFQEFNLTFELFGIGRS